jgi:Mg/Co/Ni transporter MgtE
MDSGKMVYNCKREDLYDVVKYTQSELGSLIKEKYIQVDLDITTQDTKAFFDKQRII